MCMYVYVCGIMLNTANKLLTVGEMLVTLKLNKDASKYEYRFPVPFG